MPQDPGYGDRRKERDDRRRSQAQQGTNVVPPSPALVRHGSKQRKIPAVLTPGQLTPQPAQAHIPIGVNRANGPHPYAKQYDAKQYAAAANPAAVNPYDYSQQNFPQQHESPHYGRAPPILPAPATVSNVRVMRDDIGTSYQDFDDTKPSFLRILTCRC